MEESTPLAETMEPMDVLTAPSAEPINGEAEEEGKTKSKKRKKGYGSGGGGTDGTNGWCREKEEKEKENKSGRVRPSSSECKEFYF